MAQASHGNTACWSSVGRHYIGRWRAVDDVSSIHAERRARWAWVRVGPSRICDPGLATSCGTCWPSRDPRIDGRCAAWSGGGLARSEWVRKDHADAEHRRCPSGVGRRNRHEAELARVVELVDLTAYRGSRVDGLSGGQVCRVSLAVALLGTRSFWFGRTNGWPRPRPSPRPVGDLPSAGGEWGDAPGVQPCHG